MPGTAAERRRSAHPPVSDATPAGWLLNHAYPYVEAIGTVAGPATMIGLGDDTHGTHEFFDVKLRMIEKLSPPCGVKPDPTDRVSVLPLRFTAPITLS